MAEVEIPEEVQRFREVAEEYCQWVEGAPSNPETEVLTAVRLLAGLLYLIQNVPNTEPEGLPEPELMLKGDNTLGIYQRFSSMPFQYYSEMWRPHTVDEDQEPVVGDLADDLMDLYLDLKQGLKYMEEGHPFEAVFYWNSMYGFHWGRHASSALHALHGYLTDPNTEFGSES